MTAVQKQDSNQTGLRFAEEASLGVLPGSPVWYPMEPNSYGDFGGEITTVARNPINASRQRQKGVTTDLDASGGLESDLTQTNFERLSQGFFFANLREKFDTIPFNGTTLTDVATDGTANDYRAAAFGIGVGVLRRVVPGNLLLAEGFSTAANNGLKVVASITADTNILVTDTAIETEAADAAQRIQVVGHQFGSGAMNVNATVNDLPKLELAGLVAATGVLTFTGVVANNETVTIGGQVYTFKTALTPAANEVLIGADQDASLTNLTAAVNAGAGSGTLYGAGTVANAHVTAVADTGLNTMTVTARKAGAIGNTVATTETVVNASFGGATLTGGVGTSFDSLGLIAGEWIYIGGDSAALKFVTAANNGWARIKTIESAALTLDKTQGIMVDETGTGLTIQLFFGKVVKNEADPTLIRRRSYQLERTLGAPDDSLPTQIQSEYLVGAVPNELTLNFETADKVTMNLSFVATDNEQRTGATGLKSGSRPDLVASDAFNTTSHFSRLKLSIATPTDSCPTALFGFVTDFNVSINNNVSPNKAIGVLGAFDVTAGQFNVDGTVTAYFSNVTAVQAVRNNEDVTLDFAIVKDNAGVLVDVPLIALGDGRLNVEQDQPITLPLNIPAAAHRTFNHTLLMGYFHYLPNAAE